MIYTPYIIPMLLAGILELAIIAYIERYKEVPAVRPFSLMMATGAGWSFSYALAISTINFPLRVFLGISVVIFCSLSTMAVLLLAFEYTGMSHWLTRRRLISISLLPAIVILLDITSPLHILFRYDFRIDLTGHVSGLAFATGPLYVLYLLNILAYNGAAIFILITSAVHRKQDYLNTALIVLGIAIPLLGGTAFLFGLRPIPNFDFSPMLQVFTGLFVIIGLVSGRMLDVARVARDQIIDNIQDMVIVLDTARNIVDMNRTALAAIAPSVPFQRGIRPADLPHPWGETLNCCLDESRVQKEITVETESRQRVYDLTVSPIVDEKGRRLGILLLLHEITDRKGIEEGLRESEERFRRMAETTTSGIFILEGEKYQFVNAAFSQMIGYSTEELLRMNPLEVIHPEEREMVKMRATQRIKGSDEPVRYEIRLITKTNELKWVLISVGLISMRGKPALLGTLMDITERKNLEDNLRASQKRYQDIIENQSDLVGRWLPDTTVTFVNQAHCNYFGLKREEYLGKRFIEDLPATTQQIVRNAIDAIMDGKADTVTTEEINFSPQGEKRWTVWVYHPIRDAGGNVVEFQSVGRDITDRKRMEFALEQANEELLDRLENIQLLQAQVMEQAIRDSLTGLFNRRYMEETLEREISRSVRYKHPISIIMLDMDSFKKLNDTKGHKAGDLVLQAVGQILLTQTRQMDVACRFGGEEFLLILPTTPLEIASERAESLRQAVEELALDYDGEILRATCSIGVAAFPLHGREGEAVVRAADDAMYAAKAGGRNRVIVAPLPGSPA